MPELPAISAGTAPRNARMTSRRRLCRSASRAVVQQCDAARQMVEYQKRAGGDVVCMRGRCVLETAPRQSFEVAHGVIRRVADQAAGQRHAGNFRPGLRCPRERCAQGVQEFGFAAGPRRVRIADVQARGIQPHFETIAESDERIARQPFAALDALEQESRAKRRELQIRRHRRIEIGCNVERWLHAVPERFESPQKNPSPSAGRRWVLDIDELELRLKRPAPTPSGDAPPPAGLGLVARIDHAGKQYRRAERAASSSPCEVALDRDIALGLEAFLEFAR